MTPLLRHFRTLASLLLSLFLSLKLQAQSRPVDLVFCMDLSGSTNGVLDDLRDHLWDLAEQMQTIEPTPSLRIGMVGYSRPSFGKSSGYCKIISPLTNNFEQLSFDLFSLKPYIEKGDQFVGAALQLSVKGMNWSRDNDAIKMVFLIGNGTVSLGSVNFRTSCEEAQQKGITIYPVYCTKADKSKELTGWLEIARLTGAEMKEISIHDRLPLQPVCTNLTALKEANIRLMKTYIYYGETGYARLKIAKEADNYAFRNGNLSFESRIFYKLHFHVDSKDWDLVDYVKTKGELPEFDHNSLADTMKMIPDDNLIRVVTKANEQRNGILSEMNQLIPADRRQRLKKQLEEKKIEKSDALEFVVIEAYLKNLSGQGFKIN